MVIPSYQSGKVKIDNFRVCIKHWPEGTPMVKVKGGNVRPATPPSIFNVPPSCLPTPKPQPRKAKEEFFHQSLFDKKDVIASFAKFFPEKELKQKYDNVICSRTNERFMCFFLNKKNTGVSIVINFDRKSSLCSSMTFSTFKRNVKVSVPQNILNPNNGLCRYSQFLRQ